MFWINIEILRRTSRLVWAPKVARRKVTAPAVKSRRGWTLPFYSCSHKPEAHKTHQRHRLLKRVGILLRGGGLWGCVRVCVCMCMCARMWMCVKWFRMWENPASLRTTLIKKKNLNNKQRIIFMQEPQWTCLHFVGDLLQQTQKYSYLKVLAKILPWEKHKPLNFFEYFNQG